MIDMQSDKLAWNTWNVMIWHVYVIWIIWYDWHAKRQTSMKYNPDICMKDMINDMRKDMNDDMICIVRSRVGLNNNENGKILGSRTLLCAHTSGDTYSFTMVRTRTLLGRRTIIMFDIMLSWRLLLLTSVRYRELLEYARQTRKAAQWNANRLVGPHSHVWTVCRVLKYTFKLPVRRVP